MPTVSTCRVIDADGRVICIDVHHDSESSRPYSARFEDFDCGGHGPCDVILTVLSLAGVAVREIVPPGALTASERVIAETARCAEMADTAASEERIDAEQSRSRGLVAFANYSLLRADALSTLAAKMRASNPQPNR